MTESSKVALLSNSAWYIYNYRTGLIKRLLEQNITVYALAPYEEKYTDKLIELGCNFIILNKIKSKSTNPLKHYFFFKEIKSIFRKHKFDLVFSFTPKPNIWGSIASKRAGLKIVPTINGLGHLFIKTTVYSKLLLFLYRYALKNAFRVIFQNNTDKNFFELEQIVTCSKTLLVNGSGVDLHLFYPKPYSIHTSPVRFIYAGRFIKEKGLVEFVQAAKKLKAEGSDAEFLVLGMSAENPSAISLEQVLEWQKQGAIKYIGKSDQVSEVLNNVDVVVLPSYYREGIPKILIEACAKALPIITTDNVGCKEVIEDGVNGYMVEPKNVESLAQAMKKMVSSGLKTRIEMGLNSRKIAEQKFDENFIIDTYLSLCEQAVHVNILKTKAAAV